MEKYTVTYFPREVFSMMGGPRQYEPAKVETIVADKVCMDGTAYKFTRRGHVVAYITASQVQSIRGTK